MLLALQPKKFVGNLYKKPPNNMNELQDWAKDYIKMKEMLRFWNEVRQAGQN